MRLVLSLFPGIGLLDRAFEEVWGADICIVRGPDLLWGGDARAFHAPAGKFDGIIGGPPCQFHSAIARIARSQGFTIKPDMIPEFTRIVHEAQPDWWLMENVRHAPTPCVPDYRIHEQLIDNRSIPDGDGIGQEQNRLRKWVFGTRDGRRLRVATAALEAFTFEPAVLANGMRQKDVALGGSSKPKRSRSRVTGRRRTVAESCKLQGLPEDYLAEGTPFTNSGKQLVIGNGVPLPMGRAIATAVLEALAR